MFMYKGILIMLLNIVAWIVDAYPIQYFVIIWAVSIIIVQLDYIDKKMGEREKK